MSPGGSAVKAMPVPPTVGTRLRRRSGLPHHGESSKYGFNVTWKAHMFAANPTPWMVLISLILLVNVIFLFSLVKRTYAKPAEPVAPVPAEKSGEYVDPLSEISKIVSDGQRPGTSHALANLVRALYLDQSTFTFNTLEPLDDDMRALAAALIDAHLNNRYRADEWERAYEAVKPYTLRTTARPTSPA